MAITSSAKKAIRGAERKRVFNVRRMRAIKDAEKEITKLIEDGKAKDANKALPHAYKVIDKAAKMGTLKKNTASRMKARLNRVIKVAVAKK